MFQSDSGLASAFKLLDGGSFLNAQKLFSLYITSIGYND